MKWLSIDISRDLPWWAIVIIILSLIILVSIYPFFHWQKKKCKNNQLENNSIIEPKSKKAEKNPANTPYWGIYNWFGKKQALRTTITVYVQENQDPCPLCRPFENQVISLEEYGQNVTTMSEAISRGYHHLGCKHIDIDYFHGSTIIPVNKWTPEQKELNYLLRLKQYKFEEEIRNLKYTLENKTKKIETQDQILIEIQKKQQKLAKFCQVNGLKRNELREDPNISDIEKFD